MILERIGDRLGYASTRLAMPNPEISNIIIGMS